MKNEMHIDMTGVAARAVFGNNPITRVIAQYGEFPDEARDIAIQAEGNHFLGMPLATLSHFMVPRDEGFRGYCWRDDRSVRPHIPIGPVPTYCNTHRWEPITGHHGAFEHPALRQIHLGGWRVFENITFPTAGDMVNWLESCLAQPDSDPPKLLGCIAHFVQDCCVPHHAMGKALDGHTVVEAALYEYWRKVWRGNNAPALPVVNGAGTPPTVACERNARHASEINIDNANQPEVMDLICRAALSSTMSVFTHMRQMRDGLVG